MIPEQFQPVRGRSVQIDELDWVDFPAALSAGGIRWKLLNVAPELGSWAAVFDCPQRSSFAPHVHIGPGEYFLTRGRMEVRGGKDEGGVSVCAPAYGYEACQAFHGMTNFLEDSEFYMTFLGPLNFVDGEGGNTIALVTWQSVQAAWEEASRAAKG